VTHENNAQNGSDLPRMAELLRQERPKASPVRLDEIKRDVIRRTTRTREPRLITGLRRRVLALTFFVMLFAISTSNATASLLKTLSGGSLGPKTLGYGNQSSGVQFFFGAFGFGGHSSDDAGHETYCPDDDKGSDDHDASSGDKSDTDKGSDDRDGSSSDNSDGDKYSDDRDKSSGDASDKNEGSDDYDASSGDKSDSDGKSDHDGKTDRDECSTDRDTDKSSDHHSDKSSDHHSDKSSDDNDKSSDDDSDRDKDKSDDRDGSSDDKSDHDDKSDDNDKSSGDNSDWSDDNDKSSDDHSD
jgi:hypothetical protein